MIRDYQTIRMINDLKGYHRVLVQMERLLWNINWTTLNDPMDEIYDVCADIAHDNYLWR